MEAPVIHRGSRTRERNQERGVTIILVALAMVAVVAMAALSIDVITLYLANAEAQRSADAAALAAARMLAITGMTGDPANTSLQWVNLCGGVNSPASEIAKSVALQNAVSGIAPDQVTVNYSAGGASAQDCEGLGAAFGVNPTVTVKVQRTNLPTFFSRLWNSNAGSVSATASAEAFNPSNSGNVGNNPSGTIVPVWPRCVKPWIVPNVDPMNPATCATGTCQPLVDTATGSIVHGGVNSAGTGVIGEQFTLTPDCSPAFPASCSLVRTTPTANLGALDYLPGQAPTTAPTAVPSCSSAGSFYEQAIAGCDQATVYQCGIAKASASPPNQVDLGVNPTLDTSNGVQCLIHQNGGTGQDTLDTTSFPFQMTAGNNNPLASLRGKVTTSSSSLVALPIYDSQNDAITPTGTTAVTIIGFLQVFINNVDPVTGNMNVNVLNVTGCSNIASASNAIGGISPVLVRLIQKYP